MNVHLLAFSLKRSLSSVCLIALLSACGSSGTDPAQSGSSVDAPVMDVRFGSDDDNQVVFGSPQSTQKIRVATFNVRKFFDLRCDSRDCSGTFELEPSPAEFTAKAQQLAQGIERLNADIVLLQEIESVDCLNALQDALKIDYPVSKIAETNKSASLDVAVLARGELVSVFSHTDVKFSLSNGQTRSFARDFQEVHLEINGQLVVAFNAHFVSKRTDEDGVWREAEASQARKIILERVRKNPNALIIMGGDLNDTPDSKTLRKLQGSDGFFRVASELGDDAGTHIFDNELQALDHIFLIDTAMGRYVEGSVQVVRTGERGLAGSDHAALTADFEI